MSFLLDLFSIKKITYLLAIAFTTVFIFGCVQSAAFATSLMQEHASNISQKSVQNHNGHMDIVLPLPTLPGINKVIFLALSIFFIVTVSVLVIFSMHLIHDRFRGRWRKRSTKEIFSLFLPYLKLFRIGILNPKIF